ncbi:MAG: hypothetical protein V1717_00080 [Candidatus Micrarchaeota archaeon]
MRKIAAFALLAFAFLFLGCLSPEPEQDTGVSGTPQDEGGKTVLAAIVYFKGPVEGADVSVYSLNANGSINERLAGPLQTDEDGEAYFEIIQPTGRFLVESVGGAYYEDAGRPASEAYAGKPVVQSISLPGGYSMRSFVPAGNDVVIITPFTEMAASLAQHSIRKGTALDAAARAANTAVSQQYRQDSVIRVVPSAAYDPSAIAISIREGREYGLLLAGMVEEARAMNVEPAQLAVALAEDWSDGKLDGKQDGKPINLETESGSPIALSASANLAGLQAGINAFLASPVDATQIKQFPISSAQVSTDPSFYIDTNTLPAWIDGQPGSFALTAVGGKPAYSWALKKGSSMPPGFSLSPNGTISGTGSLQNSVGSISPPFTVVVSDSSKPPKSREMELRIEIIPEPPQLEVEDVECEVGRECNVQIASNVIGGTPPYHFAGYSSDKGRYPLDLMLWTDGTLRGTPSAAGTFAIQACVVDLIGWEDCQDVSIHVGGTPTTCSGDRPQYMNCGGNEMCCHQGYDKCCNADGIIMPSDSSDAQVCCKAVQQPTVQSGGGEISCEPGHYAVYCGGWRCCLNGWVCVGGGRCAPG